MIVGSGNEVFTWKVFSEYIEEEEKVLEPWVINPEDGFEEYYRNETFIRGKGMSKEYRPVEYPSLYVEFQKINSKKSAMEFAQRFGLPVAPEETALGVFLKRAKNVRECLRLYNAIKEGLPLQEIELEELSIKDAPILHEKLKRFTKEKVNAMRIEKWVQIVLETSKDIGKYRTQEQGHEALIEHINKHLEGVRPVLLYKEEGGFTFGQTCNSLLQFIYLQLFENISQKKKFSQCLKCHSWFVPTKAGMKFCPPPPWKKRSDCANQVYVSENDQRKDIKKRLKKGMSLEEAAAGYDMEKVQEWVKKGLIKSNYSKGES